MTPAIKSLIVAVVQVALVASLGAKLLYDRATRPRVWVRAAPYDPNLPIRGRYVRLRLVVEPAGLQGKKPTAHRELHDLVVPFFIPEHVPDPSRRAVGEALWVEVTIPKRGPPRPIQLGVKQGDGPIVPLALR